VTPDPDSYWPRSTLRKPARKLDFSFNEGSLSIISFPKIIVACYFYFAQFTLDDREAHYATLNGLLGHDHQNSGKSGSMVSLL
jgi:hypothetical protein